MRWRTFQNKREIGISAPFDSICSSISFKCSKSKSKLLAFPAGWGISSGASRVSKFSQGWPHFLPFFTELFRIWASQRLAPCRARANVCHHDGEGHGIYLQVVREPWPQLYSIEPPWRWLEMNHDQIRPNLGVCFTVCFLASCLELFNF